MNVSYAQEPRVFIKLQSAYLFKIANLVIWPDTDELAGGDVFGICIVGGTGELLKEMNVAAKKLKIHKRSALVIDAGSAQLFDEFSEMEKCNLVYLYNKVDSELIRKWTSLKNRKNTLWVASPNLTSVDVYIDLVKEDSRLSIYVNKDQLAVSPLSIAGPLLSVSRAR